jgi:deazaflavin-dependent oxidoreductase (nitroreductase family)
MFFDDANGFQRWLRRAGGYPPVAWFFALALHHLDRPVLRLTHGRQSLTSLLTGLPVVALTTVGARSGQRRAVPLIGVPDGDRIVIIASNYGQTHRPAWYYNLKANPDCTVMVAGTERALVARELEGAERDAAWNLDLRVYPPRGLYAQRTSRQIPVIVLEPAA